MIILLSPSKTLRKEKIEHPHPTNPIFPEKSKYLMNHLKNTSRSEIKKLMKISDNLTDLNYDRFQEFETDFSKKLGEPAIFTFKGDVFQGLEAENWSEEDLEYAESRLFILSGLYGLLRPSTLVQPYRLEMGTALPTENAKNLYEFWDNQLTDQIKKELSQQQNKFIVNLASQEYSKAIHFQNIKAPQFIVHFREWRNEKWTFISFNAKKARGTMARYIIQNRIEETDGLKGFNLDGYAYNEELSSDKELFFTK